MTESANSRNLPPARLFVLLARRADVGVILRRGPSEWVQLIHWDTKKDIFTPGQWFKGRLYNDRCDLSPDGSLLVYCANKGYNRNADYANVWTAISKPPYLTALALWPYFSGTWQGGGLFEADDHLRLNHFESTEPHPDNRPPRRMRITPLVFTAGMEPPPRLYHQRLERDGWQVVESEAVQRPTGPPIADIETPPTNWHKLAGRFTLSQFVGYHPAPQDIYEFMLIDRETGDEMSLENVTWADWDQNGRLVLAKAGKIMVATFVSGEMSLTELVDFNAHQPEPVIAPEWATQW